MDATHWVEHFTRNRKGRMEIPWALGVHVEPHLCRPLTRSLQRFQIGESGDGSHLKRVAARTGNPQYVRAIEAFVREEQEHAEILAGVLRRLDAPLLKRHWSDNCFRVLCLVSGLRTELLVILVAEIIARRYYDVVLESTGDPVVKAVCRQILHDEDGHIAFHSETLKQSLSTLSAPARWALRSGWRLFFGFVCLLVTYDHRDFLRAAGRRHTQFHHECLTLFDSVAPPILAGPVILRATNVKAGGSGK